MSSFLWICSVAMIVACLGRRLQPRGRRWECWPGSSWASPAMHVGIAAWLGILVGRVATIAIAFVMSGVFVVALIT